MRCSPDPVPASAGKFEKEKQRPGEGRAAGGGLVGVLARGEFARSHDLD